MENWYLWFRNNEVVRLSVATLVRCYAARCLLGNNAITKASLSARGPSAMFFIMNWGRLRRTQERLKINFFGVTIFLAHVSPES